MTDERLSTQPAPLSTLPASLDVPPARVAPDSAGAMLRALRESAGVDAALLASAMKVSLQKLEALEQNRFDELPDITFARGLASSICRAFGTDPAPVLERMPAVTPALQPPRPGLNAPFRRASDGPEPILRSKGTRPWLIAVVLLLFGAVALWLWPTLPIRVGGPESAGVVATAPAATDPGEPAGEASAVPATSEAGDSPATMPTVPALPPAAEGDSANKALPAEPAAAEQARAPEMPVPSPEAPPPAPTLLVLKATGESWVTVRDAAGNALVNRALAAGETVTLDGPVPLSVTVGRKDDVQVEVRGKPLDIRSLGSSTVARFQVKE